MLGRIWFWITHHHEWETIDQGRWKSGMFESYDAWGTTYTLRCKGCGKVKLTKLSI